ncbi:MAG: hypothetical protein ACI9KE_000655 [Polyangiales bacterium]|jgi:hypothetical protein
MQTGVLTEGALVRGTRLATKSRMTHGPIVALLFVVLAGCQMPNPDPVRFPMTEGNELSGSQVSVGLRVTLDPAPGSARRVHLVAVVQDLRGNVSLTELGDYEGVISEQPTDGEDLVRVAIVAGSAVQDISLRHVDGFVEVHRVESGEREITHRIPVEGGASIVPREPSLESEETPEPRP